MARRGSALIALVVAVGCYRPPPATVEPVRFYAAPGLPGALVAELARGFQIARPTLVATVEEAEVAWLRNPAEAIALGARAVPGSAPEQPRVPEPFLDPKRRFAPVGAVATVIVASARGEEPFVADELRELADPRLRGRVALTRLGSGDGPLLVAALELAYGERGATGWLETLAANAPTLVDRDAEVVERVASGAASFGLVDSLTAGRAAGPAGLRLLFTDQKGKGSVVIPTALVVLPGASASARKFSAWLAGPDTEGVLAQRVVGLLPLREEATAPAPAIPVWKLAVLSLDWSALAEREVVWRRRLAEWPKRPPLGQ
jgi:iron(III) transport system substrate-binding protein